MSGGKLTFLHEPNETQDQPRFWEVQEAAGSISALTTSAKPVGVGAASQPLIPPGEESSLLTHIAATVNASLSVRMKS